MRYIENKKSGFTAVELLITLFVAAAFLLAGYQLFNVVINDGGDTRAESRASNVGYDYLRRYSNSATNPCVASTPIANQAVSVEGLTNTTITVVITCPSTDTPSLSKVESIVSYGAPVKDVRYATYTDKSKGPTPVTGVTDGLVAWWPMNGNTQSSVGGHHLTNQNTDLTNGQNGQPNGAYLFTKTDPSALYRNNFSNEIQNLSAFSYTAWVYPSNNPTTHENYLGFRDDGVKGAYILQLIGTNTLECRLRPSGTVWANPAPSGVTVSPNTWQMVSLVYNGSTLRCFVNNTGSASVAIGWPSSATPTNLPFYVGGQANGLNNLQGRVDDVRVYNRALSTTEINQLVTAGAQ